MCSLTIECVLLLQLTAKKEECTVLLGQRDALQAAVDKREVTVTSSHILCHIITHLGQRDALQAAVDKREVTVRVT